jgi:hypothetical protein
MRNYILVLALFLVGGGAFGQNSPNFPKRAGAAGHFTAPSAAPSKPNLVSFNTGLNAKKAQIVKDYRAGKLNKQEAKERMMYLKQVRGKQLEFSRKNGGGDITPDQKSQLEKMLE